MASTTSNVPNTSDVAAPQVDEGGFFQQNQVFFNKTTITGLAFLMLFIYLLPMGYAVVTSLKTRGQASDSRAPILPMETLKAEVNGENYEIFQVPFEDGVRELVLLQPGRRTSTFVDPNDPELVEIEWEGNWRQLDPVRSLAVQWDNYNAAWNFIDFARLLWNTLFYAFVTMLGTLVASSLTAYGFARFRFPGKNILFAILMSTIVLPPAVTLVPKYAFFINVMGWGGTWLPLIVPQMFGNAYNIFLLRQYFLTIPREMEEAAYIDGAGPLRTFWSIILPQSIPVLMAVSLFHFFFAWNDFFEPLIYLAGSRERNPITVGLMEFNGLYSAEPNLILAAAIISMVLPLAIFFLAQRVFIQGIVITGVDK
jgi:multiple sugar transport system permease protein